MTEKEWAKRVRSVLQGLTDEIQGSPEDSTAKLHVLEGKRLAYAFEVRHYAEPDGEPERAAMTYQTDLLVTESAANGTWKPRVVIELKLGEPTTHDAITYSQKATAHKNVHPYLRYGILIGSVKSLSGRFFRHGENFDFMASWKTEDPDANELLTFSKLLEHEVRASQNMERVLFDTRSQDRQRYSIFHRKLELR